jgi:hypothetical protein
VLVQSSPADAVVDGGCFAVAAIAVAAVATVVAVGFAAVATAAAVVTAVVVAAAVVATAAVAAAIAVVVSADAWPELRLSLGGVVGSQLAELQLAVFAPPACGLPVGGVVAPPDAAVGPPVVGAVAFARLLV